MFIFFLLLQGRMNEQKSRDRLRWKIKIQKRRQYHIGKKADVGGDLPRV